MYKIGKITLTQQALAVFILQAIIAVSFLFMLRKKPVIASGAFIGVLIGGSYATYLTNCTVVGECNALAWFLVAMNVVSVLVLPVYIKMFNNINRK